jgi:hypothetical protein
MTVQKNKDKQLETYFPCMKRPYRSKTIQKDKRNKIQKQREGNLEAQIIHTIHK